MYKSFFKRLFDFGISFFLLVLIFPVLFILAVLLFFQNKGNPYFFQERPGKDAKPFKIIKFKTMTDTRDANGVLLSDAERLTKIGRIVRKTSLDELPQLLNVIKGDMSLVGPRPLLTNYLHLYDSFQKRRHEVKPGITGWAQVNGRNAISWDQKFAYDVWYVEHLSFFLDVKIIFKTLQKVLKREGINSADAATIEPFHGKY